MCRKTEAGTCAPISRINYSIHIPKPDKMKKVVFLPAILMLMLAITSCSKDKDIEEPAPPSTETFYYKLHRVENFAVENDDQNPTQSRPAVFFSLYDKKEVTGTYSKTNRWDLSFGDLYNSFIGGNNGADARNLGNGGIGKGGIQIIKKKFDEVTELPAGISFLTATGVIGTDEAGAFGVGTGWYLYDYGGMIIGDGSTQKQHIAYALAEPVVTTDGKTIEARTLIIRTAKGDLAKMKIISCYKDLFSPSQWYKDAPKMFFTFEYVVIPAGETKFVIKP
jgi:hypothetical protein